MKRYMVKSGLKVTRVGSFQQAVEIAQKWFIADNQPVTISDMRKVFNPTIINNDNQLIEVYP